MKMELGSLNRPDRLGSFHRRAIVPIPAGGEKFDLIESSPQMLIPRERGSVAEPPAFTDPRLFVPKVRLVESGRSEVFSSDFEMRLGRRQYSDAEFRHIHEVTDGRVIPTASPLPLDDQEAISLEVSARHLRSADRDLCRDFRCGEAPYQRVVTDWIRFGIWQIAEEWRPKIPTILALRDAEVPHLAGFGSWGHVEANSNADFREEHIELAYFGVHLDYQGRSLVSGELLADHLLATVLADALGHPASTPSMPVLLACHQDNDRGLRFWRRHHFEVVKEITQESLGTAPQEYLRMVLGGSTQRSASL